MVASDSPNCSNLSNSATSPIPSRSLLAFALAFYAEPQIAEACLLLQDQHNANVCLLIGLHWMDVQGRYLSSEDVASLTVYIQSWVREVVMPLREIRRTLKKPFENYAQDNHQEQLRQSIKQAEILAEKKLLVEIELWLEKISVTPQATRESNLNKYFISLKMETSEINSIRKKLGLP